MLPDLRPSLGQGKGHETKETQGWGGMEGKGSRKQEMGKRKTGSWSLREVEKVKQHFSSE